MTSQVQDVTVSTNRLIVIIRSSWFIPAVAGASVLLVAALYVLYRTKKRAMMS